MSKIQTIILAGGQGSRLRPYTTVLPKPLMPVGDLPIAEIIIRQLKYYGLTHIAIATGHLSGLIQSFFGDGRRWGVNIQYVLEDQPLGTAGALKLVENLEDDFLVINGDILTDVNLKELFAFHKKKKAQATIVCKERIVKTDFGVVEIDRSEQLVDYIEKPEHRSYVSTGINILTKECQKYIKPKELLGMPDLMLRLKKSDKKVSCFKMSGVWLDLGRLEDLEAAQEVFDKNRRTILPA